MIEVIDMLEFTTDLVDDFARVNTLIVSQQFDAALDELSEEIIDSVVADWDVGSAIAATTGVSVGYVLWTIVQQQAVFLNENGLDPKLCAMSSIKIMPCSLQNLPSSLKSMANPVCH